MGKVMRTFSRLAIEQTNFSSLAFHQSSKDMLEHVPAEIIQEEKQRLYDDLNQVRKDLRRLGSLTE